MSAQTYYNTFLFWTDKTKMEMSGHKEWCHLGWNHAPHINPVPPLKQYDVGVRILACFSQNLPINAIMNSSPLAKH